MEVFWYKDKENYQKFDSIKNDMEVATCIIGGGLTGLSCGYYLSKYQKIAIIDRDEICSHTSGKNTGKITSQHGLFYDYLLNSEGIDFATKYMEANEEAIDNIEKIIKEENIKCDFKRTESYVFTQAQDDIDKMKREEEVVNSIKHGKSEFVEKIELPINNVKGAIKFNNQAQMHPVKYAYGLCKAILKNNGNIYENSKATNIENINGKYVITVNNNKIIAKNIIIATRYPFISVPGYYFMKMYQSTSFAVVADVNSELFNGMYINSQTPTISFRAVNDGDKQLLLAVGYDYKTGAEDIENGYEELEKIVKKMYPNAQILYKWSAEDCISLDKIPYIGTFSTMMENVYVATGFNKWGLTSSNISANIITDEILEKENKYKEIFRARRMEPVKNIKEVGNMLKEAGESLVLGNINPAKKDVPKCAHLGCELHFNEIENIWECPCHGSKYTADGKVIETPANKNIEIKNN